MLSDFELFYEAQMAKLNLCWQEILKLLKANFNRPIITNPSHQDIRNSKILSG